MKTPFAEDLESVDLCLLCFGKRASLSEAFNDLQREPLELPFGSDTARNKSFW